MFNFLMISIFSIISIFIIINILIVLFFGNLRSFYMDWYRCGWWYYFYTKWSKKKIVKFFVDVLDFFIRLFLFVSNFFNIIISIIIMCLVIGTLYAIPWDIKIEREYNLEKNEGKIIKILTKDDITIEGELKKVIYNETEYSGSMIGTGGINGISGSGTSNVSGNIIIYGHIVGQNTNHTYSIPLNNYKLIEYIGE